MSQAGRDLVVGPDGLVRCAWGAGVADYADYHDSEWGVPVHGDDALFERITLEAFQSGLSWLTILRKRENFRAAFEGFAIPAVAAFGPADGARLLADAGIVRNRAKIDATLANARAALALLDQDGPGALDRLVWSFAPPPSARAAPVPLADVPAVDAGLPCAWRAALKAARVPCSSDPRPRTPPCRPWDSSTTTCWGATCGDGPRDPSDRR